MELNFKYTDGGVVKYLTLNVEEHPEFVLNYSNWSGTWMWRSGGGVGDEKRYFNYFSGNSNRWPYISTALNQFANWDGDNVLVLDSSSHFYSHVESTYEWGAWSNSKTLEFGEGGNCRLNWYIFTDRSVNPPVDYIRANGLYDVRPEGGESNGANQPFQGAGMNPGYYPYSTADAPKMAFWLIRMYDDVASSDTYQQYFDCLLITIKGQETGQGSSYQAGVQVFDMRLFDGAKKPVPPSRSTAKGNTPNGFRGTRSDTSDSDTESHIGSAITSYVNYGNHGVRLYRLGTGNIDIMYECLWSDSFWDKWNNAKWNPLSGILALQAMPCEPDATFTNTQEVFVCGKRLDYHPDLGSDVITYGDVPDNSTAEKRTKIFRPKEYSGSFLDWSAFTSVKFRLPFIGIVPVDVSKIMDGGIFAKYNIDFLTGNCLVQIYTIPSTDVMGTEADWDVTYGGCLCMIGQYAGNCAHKLTISGTDFGGGQVMGSVVSSVMSIGTAALAAATGVVAPEVAAIGGAVSVIGNTAKASMAQHHNQVIPATPNADTMGMLVPALIIERPIDITPLDENGEATVFETFNGRPAASGGTVKDYKSFDTGGGIFIQGVLHADTLYATEDEKRQIEQAFAKGVYL